MSFTLSILTLSGWMHEMSVVEMAKTFGMIWRAKNKKNTQDARFLFSGSPSLLQCQMLMVKSQHPR